LNLILLEPDDVQEGVARIADRRAEHIREILSSDPDDTIRVGMVNGATGTAVVERMGAGEVVLRCEFTDAPPPPPAVDLLLALPRPRVMKRLWAQLAAIGVGQIILTNARKVERSYFDSHVVDAETYRPLLIEGLQQAQATWLPEVSIHRRFKVLVEDDLGAIMGHSRVLLAAHPEATQRIAPVVRARAGNGVLLAVGSEGGWTEYELDLLQAHGFQAITMGPRTLRTDTACIALLALVHEALFRTP
jgi:16S rRNA (uracil1498-N3)-methyltransferase